VAVCAPGTIAANRLKAWPFIMPPEGYRQLDGDDEDTNLPDQFPDDD